MGLKVLNSKDRKLFYEKLNPYFGLPEEFKFEGVLFVNTKNKYYLVDNKYKEIAGEIRTKVIGLYIAEINKYGEIRLSIEGSQIVGPYASSHILELSEKHAEDFMRGEDINLEESPNNQYYILYFIDGEKKHYIGCGKIKDGKLLNFISKSRRLH